MDSLKSKCRGLESPIIKDMEGGIPTIAVSKKTAKNSPLNESYLKYPLITPNSVEFFLNIKTISEANCQEHWTKRHKRHKKQKNILFWSFLEVKPFVKLPCTITFIRLAPKTLDVHDNLPMSQKWLCDQLCAEITGDFRAGRADDSDQIKIKYDQIKSKVYAVKIIIEF